MEWAQVLGLLLSGAVGPEIVRQIGRGVRQRKRAEGGLETREDALRRSRYWWMEVAHTARHLVIKHGGTVPPIVETDDPFIRWEQAAQAAVPVEGD